MLKQCTKCRETKAFELFYKYKTSKDGLKSRCKQCEYETSRAYAINNREKDRESARKSYAKHKESRHKMQEAFRATYKKGVYHSFFEQGDYIGEGILDLRMQAHRGGYSNVNKGNLTFVKFKVLEYIHDETKRKQRERYWIKKINPSLNIQLSS